MKPWDARLAAWLVRPLLGTAIMPNHLTTLRLVVGLAGAGAFASGTAPTLGAVLTAISTFLDHTDGELARIGGLSSRFGHYYDLVGDFLVMMALFFGIGIGLRGELGNAALALGGVSGVAIALMFHLRNEIESGIGKSATKQPALAGFEPEDVFYLLPVVTLGGWLEEFLVAAAIGAPLAAVVVIAQYVRFRRTRA